MPVRTLPDLTPEQVVRLQDALLSNADRLLTASILVLDAGNAALARSLAILGLEESGKAIAIHERRVAMDRVPAGSPFRTESLDELWASHQKKLETVHHFLVSEPYWFDTVPPDPDENAGYLGAIKSWSRRQDKLKQRGFYVDIGRTGSVMAPTDVDDEGALREVIARVHQIGWQLRLGEHIEGKRQDQREAGLPGSPDDDLAWIDSDGSDGEDDVGFLEDLKRSIRDGVPGEPLANPAYRFNPPGRDMSPFRNVGKPGYEAETRELRALADDIAKGSE